MPDSHPTHPSPILPHQIPHNFPAQELQALLAEFRGLRWAAVREEVTRPAVLQKLFGELKEYALAQIAPDGMVAIVACGMTLEYAQARAEKLNAGDFTTGLHTWN